MGSKTTNTTTENHTATNAPPEWALPGMQELASRITSIVPNVPGPQYTGNFIAAPNAMQLASLPLYTDASGQATSAADMMGGAAHALTAGGPSFGSSNMPMFDTRQAAEAATAPLLRQLTEQILPQLQSSALASGAYGNSRMNSILPSLAIRDTMRGAQEVGAGMQQSAFNQWQNAGQQQFGLETQRGLGTEGLRQQGLTALPNMLDAQLRFATGAGDIMQQGGGMRQQWDQAAIDNELARYQYNLQYPFQGLDTASQLLAGLAHGYGTQTSNGTTKQVQSSGGLAPILGGLMGAGMMAYGAMSGNPAAAMGGMNSVSSAFAPKMTINGK